jgi:hypothetical protein
MQVMLRSALIPWIIITNTHTSIISEPSVDCLGGIKSINSGNGIIFLIV